jgi:hypothetical protein
MRDEGGKLCAGEGVEVQSWSWRERELGEAVQQPKLGGTAKCGGERRACERTATVRAVEWSGGQDVRILWANATVQRAPSAASK